MLFFEKSRLYFDSFIKWYFTFYVICFSYEFKNNFFFLFWPLFIGNPIVISLLHTTNLIYLNCYTRLLNSHGSSLLHTRVLPYEIVGIRDAMNYPPLLNLMLNWMILFIIKPQCFISCVLVAQLIISDIPVVMKWKTGTESRLIGTSSLETIQNIEIQTFMDWLRRGLRRSWSSLCFVRNVKNKVVQRLRLLEAGLYSFIIFIISALLSLMHLTK